MSELLVREYTAGRPSRYHSIDLPGSRGPVVASAVLEIANDNWECVTLVPDTAHNRVMFLQRKGLKVFENTEKGWKEIPESYLGKIFESYKTKNVAPEEVPEDEIEISTIEDFLKQTPSNQIKIVKELAASADKSEKAFLGQIVKTSDPLLSEKARKLAEDILASR